MVESKTINYIKGNKTIWEKEPLETFANMGRLFAFRHLGYWQLVDTLRDK